MFRYFQSCLIKIYYFFSKLCVCSYISPIISNKLELYGIRGLPLQLFNNFLSGRRQLTKIGKSISSPKPVRIGVPQGSQLVISAFCYFYYT